MYYQILRLLNVKPSESKVVRELFTIQFFLGVATAFLFTSSLAMFISSYEITMLPVSYLLSAGLLFVFNRVYSYLDERLTSPKLLQLVILFSAISIFLLWVLLQFFPFKNLPLIIAAWYMLIYMLVGYAFWGMSSIIFNVRESKRLFSIVGAGDIPAKMLGYFSVTALVPFIGSGNLLWVSIISFSAAWFFLKRFQAKGLLVETDPNASSHAAENHPAHSIHISGFLTKFFDNRLVFSIALLSLVSYIVFSFIDFTFLSDLKIKYHHSEEIATFIAIFFAVGRFVAIGIKILFSSRMISRIGLTNALLVTPLLLLFIDFFIILSGDQFISHLYIFGFMVLLTEILRSTLQEPVFFILFQPLKPHDRLRGHLLAKGHTLPFALLGVGSFLLLYLQKHRELTIFTAGELLIALLFIWIVSVFIIKKQYLQTLITSLKKGYFTGAELFLNNAAVTNLLIAKTESTKPLEVIHSLSLLERSGYTDIYKLLLKNLQSPIAEIREYILTRVITNNVSAALPIISQQIEKSTFEHQQPVLVKAYYFLNKGIDANEQTAISSLPPVLKKAAMEGLLNRGDDNTERWVIDQLIKMARATLADKLLALDVMTEYKCENYTTVLEILLEDDEPGVYKKAIEVAGKARHFTLFSKVLEVSVLKQAYLFLRRSILSYGDEIFDEDNWKKVQIPNELLVLIIKTAGSIKGEKSNDFLINLLRKNAAFGDEIVEALWLKRSRPADDTATLIDRWANVKMEQSKHKMACYHETINNRNLTLLNSAILMEIRKDAQVLLKGFSLLYDAEKINRVIELLAAGNEAKISNAVEVLELIIPKRYFLQLNQMVELIDDVQHNKVLLAKPHPLSDSAIIEEVIKNNTANFSEWTRSVACYMIPKLRAKEISLEMLRAKEPKENHLFNETKNYVLSMLN